MFYRCQLLIPEVTSASFCTVGCRFGHGWLRSSVMPLFQLSLDVLEIARGVTAKVQLERQHLLSQSDLMNVTHIMETLQGSLSAFIGRIVGRRDEHFVCKREDLLVTAIWSGPFNANFVRGFLGHDRDKTLVVSCSRDRRTSLYDPQRRLLYWL